jgi:hypothetical protein
VSSEADEEMLRSHLATLHSGFDEVVRSQRAALRCIVSAYSVLGQAVPGGVMARLAWLDRHQAILDVTPGGEGYSQFHNPPPPALGLSEPPTPQMLKEAAEGIHALQSNLVAVLPELLTEVVLARGLSDPTKDTPRENEQAARAKAAGGAAANQDAEKRRRKRSTAKGDARPKIISALTVHHKYDNGSALYLEPISVSELARKAEVSKSTVSKFFTNNFGEKGQKAYMAACRDARTLVVCLRTLRGEWCPKLLLENISPPEAKGTDGE